MAVTAYKAAGTGASDASFGDDAWTTPGNIVSSNNSYAFIALDPFTNINSEYLKATNFGFTSSDVPAGSTIDGIEVRYERHADQSGLVTARMRIVKGGSIHTANVSTMDVAEWAASDETITEGGASNLWGQTFTQSDITSSTFGVALVASDTGGNFVDTFVDYIEMRIYYTEDLTIPRYFNTDAPIVVQHIKKHRMIGY